VEGEKEKYMSTVDRNLLGYFETDGKLEISRGDEKRIKIVYRIFWLDSNRAYPCNESQSNIYMYLKDIGLSIKNF
jgi:phosphoribosylaminoimidazole-succinocarboxamide synthase